jgi:SAM-dependent methyltransferase
VKYYYPEHLRGYDRIRTEGKTAWAEIHGGEGFENFSSRPFLEAVLPTLSFRTAQPEVLDYGCGTGPDACFLAEKGFRVDAIDLIPAAIEMAGRFALQRGLDIHYEVGDICELPHEGRTYDMIVDSHCLQCIVLDADRRKLFAAIRARLKPHRYYLVSSAVLDEEHEALLHSAAPIRGASTPTTYSRYGDGLIDLDTGIAYTPLEDGPRDLPDAARIAGAWYLPIRRHLRPEALVDELEREGFRVVYRDRRHAGSLACVLREA